MIPVPQENPFVALTACAIYGGKVLQNAPLVDWNARRGTSIKGGARQSTKPPCVHHHRWRLGETKACGCIWLVNKHTRCARSRQTCMPYIIHGGSYVSKPSLIFKMSQLLRWSHPYNTLTAFVMRAVDNSSTNLQFGKHSVGKHKTYL